MKMRLFSAATICLGFLLSAQIAVGQKQNGQQLTDAQKRSMLSILAGVKERVEPLLKNLLTLQAEINEQMLVDNPDLAAIDRHKSQISGLMGTLVEMRIDDIRQMLGVLTAEQRTLVRADSSKPNGEKDLFNVIVKRFGLPE